MTPGASADERMVNLDRDAVLASVNLHALADDLLARRTDSDGGSVWVCPDPDHEATGLGPSDVTVYQSRRGEQRWCCLGCGNGGTAIDLVMKAHGTGYVDSLRYLADHLRHQPPIPGRVTPEVTAPVQALHAASRTGLDAWAAHAAELLWQPTGELVRNWLTRTRRIPEDVLRINRIGATTLTPEARLATRRAVPGHRSSAPVAVLPVIAKDQVIYVQLRRVDPSQPKHTRAGPRRASMSRRSPGPAASTTRRRPKGSATCRAGPP